MGARPEVAVGPPSIQDQAQFAILLFNKKYSRTLSNKNAIVEGDKVGLR
jgi:hypothetical protein